MGDLAGALGWVNRIADEAERQDALSSVAFALASNGYLDEAESVVTKITSPEVKARTWFSIACSAPGQNGRSP